MKNYWIFSLAWLLLLGCNGNSTETSYEGKEPVQGTGASAHYATEKFVYVNTADNTHLAEIKLLAEEIEITTPDLSLFGIVKEDKRKYYDQNNIHVYSVKYKEEGFKLRDAMETLLWKVKFKEGKIKIADNEEMNDAFEIKLKEDHRIKIEKSGQELFSLKIPINASTPVKIGDDYLVSGLGYSTAAGVLMLNDLTLNERFAIMAELVNSYP